MSQEFIFKFDILNKTALKLLYLRLVWLLSAVTLGALYYFNYTDVGIVNAIKMLWKL